MIANQEFLWLEEAKETIKQSRKMTLQHALDTLKRMAEKGFDNIDDAMLLASAIADLEEVLEQMF